MRVTIVGTGYVGLVTGACLAEAGNDVVCVDCDQGRIDALNEGMVPFHEPGLEEMVSRNMCEERLYFTVDTGWGVASAEVVFICVGTPSNEDGSVDLTAFWEVVGDLGTWLKCGRKDVVVVIKSTVPPGTNANVVKRLRDRLGRDVPVVSNPEFLREGSAVEDFQRPDRIVVGVRREEDAGKLWELYLPIVADSEYRARTRPFIVMTPESAELCKYASNAFLATKISYINEIADLCEAVGADVDEVRRGMGYDKRIGFEFLRPGVGYGGSCFPKDVRALIDMFGWTAPGLSVLEAVDNVNTDRVERLFCRIKAYFGDLASKTIAVWGLAFKPNTDDVREAPSLKLVDLLLKAGAFVWVYDPEAMGNVGRLGYLWSCGDSIVYCEDKYSALETANVLVLMTEWEEFREPDFERMKRLMRSPVVFDGRNVWDPGVMERYGFVYHSVGRKTVGGKADDPQVQL